MYIGIDFGTSNSVVSIRKKNGVFLPDLCGKSGEPTIMYFDDEHKTWIFGSEISPLLLHDENVIRNLKKEIRKNPNIVDMYFGQETSYALQAKDLLKRFLSKLLSKTLDEAKKYKNDDTYDISEEKIDRIVVTVPAGFARSQEGITSSHYNDTIRTALKDIIESGIYISNKCARDTPIRIIEEPIAAAIGYLEGSKCIRTAHAQSNIKILVIDFGGGTLDLALVSQNNGEYLIQPADGNLFLGGNDYDDATLEFLLKKSNLSKENYEAPSEYYSDLYRAKTIKEQLSFLPHSPFRSGMRCSNMINITRSEFENATSELLDKFKSFVERFVDEHGGYHSINQVVLTGGSCFMPQIRECIARLYPSIAENIFLSNPSYAIANGAAYVASMNDELHVRYLNRQISKTYGFRHTIRGGSEKYITNMIFKGYQYNNNGEIIRDTSETFHTSDDQNLIAEVPIFESEYNTSDTCVEYEQNKGNFNDMGLLFEVEVPSEFAGKSTQYFFSVRMILDLNGILKIEAYHNGHKLNVRKIQ